MSPAFLTFCATAFLVVGVALILTPLPGWLHWAGCGLCGLSVYCGWRR